MCKNLVCLHRRARTEQMRKKMQWRFTDFAMEESWLYFQQQSQQLQGPCTICPFNRNMFCVWRHTTAFESLHPLVCVYMSWNSCSSHCVFSWLAIQLSILIEAWNLHPTEKSRECRFIHGLIPRINQTMDLRGTTDKGRNYWLVSIASVLWLFPFTLVLLD